MDTFYAECSNTAEKIYIDQVPTLVDRKYNFTPFCCPSAVNQEEMHSTTNVGKIHTTEWKMGIGGQYDGTPRNMDNLQMEKVGKTCFVLIKTFFFVTLH